jgi:hypothetical protein
MSAGAHVGFVEAEFCDTSLVHQSFVFSRLGVQKGGTVWQFFGLPKAAV